MAFIIETARLQDELLPQRRPIPYSESTGMTSKNGRSRAAMTSTLSQVHELWWKLLATEITE